MQQHTRIMHAHKCIDDEAYLNAHKALPAEIVCISTAAIKDMYSHVWHKELCMVVCIPPFNHHRISAVLVCLDSASDPDSDPNPNSSPEHMLRREWNTHTGSDLVGLVGRQDALEKLVNLKNLSIPNPRVTCCLPACSPTPAYAYTWIHVHTRFHIRRSRGF
jgi:hypothetical protein